MKKKHLFPLLFLFVLHLAQSCKQQAASLINPPFPELDIPFEVFEFDAAKGGSFALPTGTRIHIPANAFTTDEGTVAEGNVELRFREVEKQSEIFRSGITMRYDSAGAQDFSSAGMFELRAFSQDKALKLGKPVSIELASEEGDSDYSFYSLDEEKGWNYETTVAVDSNRYKINALDSVDKALSKTDPFGKEFFAFNYDILLDVYLGHNWPKIRKYRKNRYVRRKIERYGVRRLDQTNIGGEEIGWWSSGNRGKDPLLFWLWKFDQPTNTPRWIAKPKAKLHIDKRSAWQYKLTATYKGKKWVRNIYPVTPLRSVFAHSPEDWKKNYASYLKEVENSNRAYLEKLQKVREAAEKEKDFMRKMRVSGMGIYNYDRLLKQDDRIPVIASFDIGSSAEEELITAVYFFPENEKSVIRFTDNDFEKRFNVSPSMSGIYCVVLSDKHLARTDNDYFSTLDFDRLRREKKHRFKLKKHDTVIKSVEDLQEALGWDDKDDEQEEQPLL